LLLADLVLPGGTRGTELAAHGMGAHPGIKILLISGYADEGVRTESHAVGKVEFLRKAFPGTCWRERCATRWMAQGLNYECRQIACRR